MTCKMLKEERDFRCWASAIDPDYDDPKEFLRDVSKLVRAVREDVWKEVEPFIGLDPRHDGDAPEWDKKCPKCRAVRELKDKYAAIRSRK